jgi:hypothetical protein
VTRSIEVPIKSRAMQIIEGRLGEALDTYLRREYQDKGRTTREIALDLGVNGSTVTKWMERLGIEARAFGPRRAQVA